MWRSSGTNRLREWDFDIIVASWVESLSPGNEQRDYWGSQAADTPGSRNLIGIKNKAVDTLIDHVLFAANREELITATLPSIAYCCGTTMWFHNGVTAKSERRAGTDTDIPHRYPNTDSRPFRQFGGGLRTPQKKSRLGRDVVFMPWVRPCFHPRNANARSDLHAAIRRDARGLACGGHAF
jgi:hypothetical protein